MIRTKRPIPTFCRELHSISLQFGEPFLSKKIKLLNTIPDLKKFKVPEILLLHDTLLSMLAWPENNSLFKLAKKAMKGLIAVLQVRLMKEEQLKYELSGTGIPGTEITGQFSYEITKWLVNEFGKSVSLDSWNAKPETARLFFRQLLPLVEYESIFTGELTPLQRINKLKGKSTKSDLEWLITLFEQSDLSDSLKDLLFNELKIFTTWKADRYEFTRSFPGMPHQKKYYHKSLERTADINNILKQALPLRARLTSTGKRHLVNVAKASLAFLYRETDPFTFASAEDMICFELERGHSIALYCIKKENRLSIESYVGYLVFKNGIPVAYGGGWLFGERCQFGINILEPFRGGESGYILAQLIRVYHQYFGAKRFVVKPYQFGLHNKEGLESGAFWFYYKYGFRPAEENLQKLADEEWKKKKADKNYRTSLQTLKRFTKGNVQLLLEKNPVPYFDASIVSAAITNFIISAYDGDRMKAVKDCVRKTSKDLGIRDLSARSEREKKVWTDWSLLATATLHIGNWNNDEKKQFINLVTSKANNNELDFTKRVQKHRRFWKDLSNKFI